MAGMVRAGDSARGGVSTRSYFEGTGRGGNRLPQRLVGRTRQQRRADTPGAVRADGADRLVLAGEVVAERPQRDIRLGRDVLDGDVLQALLDGDQLGQDLRPRVREHLFRHALGTQAGLRRVASFYAARYGAEDVSPSAAIADRTHSR